VFPDILKSAEIVPFFEKGEKNRCSNYRLISILSPFSKIFEKCIYKQLHKFLKFLSKNNIISPSQYNMASEKITLPH